MILLLDDQREAGDHQHDPMADLSQPLIAESHQVPKPSGQVVYRHDPGPDLVGDND
jgi:hypothetical protein